MPGTTNHLSSFETPINHKSKKVMRFKKRHENKHLNTAQKEREEFKYNLINPKSDKEIEKETKKKSAAQALKFLRKLGRKLRRPQTVRSLAKPIQ